MQNEPSNLTNEGKTYVDLNQIPEVTLKGHMWRQEGNQLICQSCTFNHATFIEPGCQLYGIDANGTPQIRKIVPSSQPRQQVDLSE